MYRKELRVGQYLTLREPDGNWIRIDALATDAGRVQLGFDAPDGYQPRAAGPRSVRLGRRIRVTALKFVGKQGVQLGIDAPARFAIERSDQPDREAQVYLNRLRASAQPALQDTSKALPTAGDLLLAFAEGTLGQETERVGGDFTAGAEDGTGQVKQARRHRGRRGGRGRGRGSRDRREQQGEQLETPAGPQDAAGWRERPFERDAPPDVAADSRVLTPMEQLMQMNNERIR